MHLACKANDWFDRMRGIDEHGRFELVKLLMANGANFDVKDNNGDTPLHVACQERYMEEKRANDGGLGLAKLLIANGANVDAKNAYGDTPLYVACKSGYLDIMKFLFEKRADRTTTDMNGSTLLHTTCQATEFYVPCLDVAKFLIENDLDVNARDNHGNTPLHMACYSAGSEPVPALELVKLLVSRNVIMESNGADLNAKDNGEQTPLHLACDDGNLELVQLLVNRGAEVTSATTEGSTPLHLASAGNHLEIVWFLVRQHPWLVSENNDT